MIGTLCGALIGATSFAVAENFFGRGIGVFMSSPKIAAMLGAVFVGVPSLFVAVIVSGFKTRLVHSLLIGSLAGVAMVLHFVINSESKYFYEGGYFDEQRFWYDVVAKSAWLVGLPVTAVIVSASLRALLPQSR